ncbi:protein MICRORCHIDIA 7-like isoform X2 [Macadamia integrifolia]|uniref:protein MICRORCHIDIA 7-like isoform X2 n=1 Tax=Macadamia integrifolia TaxID=60698 RepID=UPI001C52DF2B|nr:protein MICRORCHIDIA 7-like isoform X2 [Macadamia integrifolia]
MVRNSEDLFLEILSRCLVHSGRVRNSEQDSPNVFPLFFHSCRTEKTGNTQTVLSGMDRLHPRYEWAFAFAELIDHTFNEICDGAGATTYARIDVLTNNSDNKGVILVEDNGPGMDPSTMRQFIYDVTSFKASLMRLGKDALILSRSGKKGRSPTQSIAMLSSRGKEDFIPLIDYEEEGLDWIKMIRSSHSDWNRNLLAITLWSPYTSEADLLNEVILFLSFIFNSKWSFGWSIFRYHFLSFTSFTSGTLI